MGESAATVGMRFLVTWDAHGEAVAEAVVTASTKQLGPAKQMAGANPGTFWEAKSVPKMCAFAVGGRKIPGEGRKQIRTTQET